MLEPVTLSHGDKHPIGNVSRKFLVITTGTAGHAVVDFKNPHTNDVVNTLVYLPGDVFALLRQY